MQRSTGPLVTAASKRKSARHGGLARLQWALFQQPGVANMNQRNLHTRTARGSWSNAFSAALAVTAAAWALPAASAQQAQDSPLSTRMQASPATAPVAASKSDAAAAFKRADANGDGKLSKDEAASLPAIAARFDEFDKDKDGFLSMDEFMAATAAPN
jgi:hypothetical protein